MHIRGWRAPLDFTFHMRSPEVDNSYVRAACSISQPLLCGRPCVDFGFWTACTCKQVENSVGSRRSPRLSCRERRIRQRRPDGDVSLSSSFETGNPDENEATDKKKAAGGPHACPRSVRSNLAHGQVSSYSFALIDMRYYRQKYTLSAEHIPQAGISSQTFTGECPTYGMVSSVRDLQASER